MITAPSMTLEVIDPVRANDYLTAVAPNRLTRPGVIAQYARDMAAKRWQRSVIRLGQAGELLDGQHRLWALIESNTAQEFWVERGVPPEAAPTIDVGLKRTVGDLFAIRGEENANILAATVRLARHLTLFPGRAPSGASRFASSSVEAIEYLDAHPGLREFIPQGRRVSQALRFAPSIAAAIHYLAAGRNREKADEFWTQMETGAGQVIDTGPYTLRQTIIADASHMTERKMDQNMVVALTIKAWNFWEADKPVKQLRWQRVGGEVFPVLGRLR